jgi:hypothetical protein
LLSYNDQSLPHEAELQRRRETSHLRAVRAASEQLRILRAGREQQQLNGDAQDAGKDGQG